MTERKAIISSRMLEQVQSKMSKMFIPPTRTPFSGPKDSEQSTPAVPQTRNIVATARPRFILNFSTRNAVPTSMSEIKEVIAATMTVKKNSMAATVLTSGACAPILQKMYGMLWKMRPGPAPGSIPAAKTAGIMARPASSAKSRSETAVPALDTIMFSSLRT